MTTIAVDDNNNIIVKASNLVIKDDAEALAQDVKTRLGLVTGENPFDLNEGIPYFDKILGKGGGISYVKKLLHNRIMEYDEYIRGIKNLTVTQDGGKLKAEIEVQSIYGDVKI